MKHGKSHGQTLKKCKMQLYGCYCHQQYHMTCKATSTSKRRKDANRLLVIILFILRLSKYTPKMSPTLKAWIALYTESR